MTCGRVTVSTHVTTSLHRSARVADRQTDIRESDQHKPRVAGKDRKQKVLTQPSDTSNHDLF